MRARDALYSRQSRTVAMTRHGELGIVDSSGRERERHPVVYGAVLRVAEGDQIKAGTVLLDTVDACILIDVPVGGAGAVPDAFLTRLEGFVREGHGLTDDLDGAVEVGAVVDPDDELLSEVAVLLREPGDQLRRGPGFDDRLGDRIGEGTDLGHRLGLTSTPSGDRAPETDDQHADGRDGRELQQGRTPADETLGLTVR